MYTNNNVTLGLLNSQCFIRALYLEKKRSERSGRGFAVILLESKGSKTSDEHQFLLCSAVPILKRITRDTDLCGWYVDRSVIGILCTEFGTLAMQSAVEILLEKITAALAAGLSSEQMAQISLLPCVYPEYPTPEAFETFEYSTPGILADEVPALSSVAATTDSQLVENKPGTNILN